MATHEDLLATKCFGFLGVGVMNSAIIRAIMKLKFERRLKAGGSPEEGLDALKRDELHVLVSPRGERNVRALIEEFGTASIVRAESNQDLIDRADVVVIGLTPPVALTELPHLSFRPTHFVINLLSTVSNAALHDLLHGVVPDIIKAVPLPPMASHHGVTTIFPGHPGVEHFFGLFGQVFAAADEKELKVLQACTSVMGHQYRQMVALHDWACAQGVPKDIGKAYLGAFFNSISFEPMESQHDDFRRLVEEQTPGGLNEQVVKEMEAHGTFAHLQEAVDKVKCRLFQ